MENADEDELNDLKRELLDRLPTITNFLEPNVSNTKNIENVHIAQADSLKVITDL